MGSTYQCDADERNNVVNKGKVGDKNAVCKCRAMEVKREVFYIIRGRNWYGPFWPWNGISGWWSSQQRKPLPSFVFSAVNRCLLARLLMSFVPRHLFSFFLYYMYLLSPYFFIILSLSISQIVVLLIIIIMPLGLNVATCLRTGNTILKELLTKPLHP